MRASYLFPLFLFFALSVSGILAAEDKPLSSAFSGPIRITNPYPLQQLHSSWAPRPTLVSAGSDTNFEMRWGWSNTALLRDSYRVDVESHNLELDLVQPLSERLEVGLRLPMLWRGSGIADDFIDNWHSMFGLPRGDRNDMPEDDYNISGLQSNGQNFGLLQEGFGFGNLSLSAAYLLSAETNSAPAFALNIEAGLPGASDGYGHSGIDLLSGLLLSKSYHDWAWYAGLAGVHFSEAETEEIFFRKNHLESFAAMEYLALEKLSVLFSLHGSSRLMDKLPEHPDYFLYLDVGLRYSLSAGSSVALALRENPGAGEGSADVTTILAWRYNL